MKRRENCPQTGTGMDTVAAGTILGPLRDSKDAQRRFGVEIFDGSSPNDASGGALEAGSLLPKVQRVEEYTEMEMRVPSAARIEARLTPCRTRMSLMQSRTLWSDAKPPGAMIILLLVPLVGRTVGR